MGSAGYLCDMGAEFAACHDTEIRCYFCVVVFLVQNPAKVLNFRLHIYHSLRDRYYNVNT